MGDAVRRVQKHLQELSRDHLMSVEDSHHENLGWLQIQLQQLCKQIEVEVRVELTRPPRLSFSKPNALVSTTAGPVENEQNATEAPVQALRAKRPESVLENASEEAPRVAKRLRLDDADDVVESKRVEQVSQTNTDAVASVEPTRVDSEKRVVKKVVKRTRKVMRPKKVEKIIKKMVKKEKTVLPSIDVSALKVVDLKAELKKRGLKQTGVKAVLVSRLKEALDAEDAQRAEEEDDDEVEVEERVVEEIWEEVEEEYEEEVEEEVVDESAPEVTSVAQEVEPVPLDPIPEHKNATEASNSVDDTVATDTPDTADGMGSTENTEYMEVSEDMFVETQELSAEDVDLKPKVETMPNVAVTIEPETVDLTHDDESTDVVKVKSALASATPNQKTSLSGMVAGSSLDEIVRESAGSEFFSPELKTATNQPLSGRKPPFKRLMSLSVEKPRSPRTETLPSIAEVDSQPSEEASTSAERARSTSVAPVSSEVAATPSQSTSSPLKSDSVKSTAQSRVSQPQTQMKTQSNDDERPRRRSLRNSSNELAKSPAVVEVSSSHGQIQVPKNGASISSTTTTPSTKALSTQTSALSEIATPSTKVSSAERSTNSVLTSDRSSSVSSFTESRRYTGSMSFVEDSQPDQSPHGSSFTNEFLALSQSSTRSASTSQLEIQMASSKMKTPDASTAVPPPNERVAQSEPRVTAIKQIEDDEAERKRREHQENIEREAQRLRMAVKQSAKKRFEEARGSSLFWAKREQAKLQIHTENSGAPVSVSTTPATPRVEEPHGQSVTPQTNEPARSTSNSSVKEPPKEPTKDKPGDETQRPEQPSVEQTEATRPTSSGTGRAESRSSTERSTSSSASLTSSSDGDANNKSQTKPATSSESAKPVSDVKRSVPTRKRSSIALDTSASTLYPSKKRASLKIRRDSDEAALKRNSLTRGTTSSRSSLSRAATSRETDAPAARTRSSLGRDKSTVSSLNKRSSIAKQPETTDTMTKSSTATSSNRPVSRVPSSTSVAAKRRDSVSSTVSSSSNVSATDVNAKPTTLMSGGAVRKPANLVSGLHSFTSLLDKDSANLSSSQGSTASSTSRQAPVVSSLKLAEKSRLIEQKKNLEKAKRKEALMKRYEEQRKADEEKKKKLAQMKEKAERDARNKREQEKAAEKKQRELELAKKRQQRIQEMRAGMEKKAEASATSKSTTTAAPVSRVAAATSSKASSQTMVTKSTKSGHPNPSKEITTYEISENEEESSESEDENDTRRNSKNIPVWALRENLEKALNEQFGPNAIDPTPSIFPDFVDSCDLEAIFEPTDAKKKKRFQRRTSSGNWLADRPTAREKAMYKRDMGFQR